jgi:hypothetical protein
MKTLKNYNFSCFFFYRLIKRVLKCSSISEKKKGRKNEIYQFVDPSHLFGLAIMKILFSFSASNEKKGKRNVIFFGFGCFFFIRFPVEKNFYSL